MQTTVRSSVSFEGVGLHTGHRVKMSVLPAEPNTGLRFVRTDIDVGNTVIPARWNMVAPSRLCTLLRNASGVEVSTVEHIMAALSGCGIYNAIIEIDGPEVPILDGSAAQFVEGILWAGVAPQNAPAQVLRILKDVEVRDGDAIARLSPSDNFEIEFHIDFQDKAIGRQAKALNLANGTFVRELCNSRTFCRHSDIKAMLAAGLAQGGDLNNAIVVDGEKVLTPGGMRYEDEAVRHKMLDAIGDLALAGAPLLGKYTGIRAGHALTNKLLHALFATPDAYSITDCNEDAARRLPGVGVCAADIPAVA